MLDPKIAERARNLIHPAIQARREPLRAKIDEILSNMSARGIAISGMTAQLVFQECEKELRERTEIAWTSLRKVHSLLGAHRTTTVAADIKHEVSIYRTEAAIELANVMKDIVARVGFGQNLSLSFAQIQAEQEINGEIDLYVDSLAYLPPASPVNADPPLIFVSCGQTTQEEISLGNAIVQLIDKHLAPCIGYFAQKQNTLDGLSRHIFGSLNKSVGLVAVMHHRGTVKTRSHEQVRASVWIEQEIAIAAFLTQVQHRDIEVAVYIQKDIKREGVRDQLLLNAQSFESDDEVLGHLEASILNGEFKPQVFNTTEVGRQNQLLAKLRQKYLLSHDNMSPGFLAGLEPLPKEWAEKELEVLGELWRRSTY